MAETKTLPENYREWTTVDKSEWGPGPWNDEPDKVQWIDEETDLDCLLHRGPGGHWCGYVGVGPDHPWHGIGYSQCVEPETCGEEWHYECTPDGRLSAHGGITFAAPCADTEDESRGVCHIAGPGRPDPVWWFGFDCAHAGDKSPRWGSGIGYERYRDRSYVENEVRSLAKQLASR